MCIAASHPPTSCFACNAARTALRELELHHEHSLFGDALAPFTKLRHLTKLTTYGVEVDEEVLHNIGSLAGLRELAIKNPEEFRPEHVVALRGLTALTKLSLQGVALNAGSISALIPLKGLAHLNISAPSSSDGDLAGLSMLTALHTFECDCDLGPDAALHISKCTQLQSLNVEGNYRLGPGGAMHLTVLTGRRHLALTHCSVGVAAITSIAKTLTALTSLSMTVDAADLATFAQMVCMPHLQRLELHGFAYAPGAMNVNVHMLRGITKYFPYLSHQEYHAEHAGILVLSARSIDAVGS